MLLGLFHLAFFVSGTDSIVGFNRITVKKEIKLVHKILRSFIHENKTGTQNIGLYRWE